MRPLLSPSPHLPNVRVHSHVSFFRRKFWAPKVMSRGSAADFLVVLCKPGNPITNTTEGDYTHLDSFLRLSSMSKVVLFGGCSSRGWGGLQSKTAVSKSISDSRAVHTWCCSYCCVAGDLARADQAQLSKIYCHKRYIN